MDIFLNINHHIMCYFNNCFSFHILPSNDLFLLVPYFFFFFVFGIYSKNIKLDKNALNGLFLFFFLFEFFLTISIILCRKNALNKSKNFYIKGFLY